MSDTPNTFNKMHREIMDLRQHNADLLRRFHDSLDRERELIRHVFKLEALLDRVPHDRPSVGPCYGDCVKCEWEQMKGAK